MITKNLWHSTPEEPKPDDYDIRGSDWPDEFVQEILTLLDRIDVEEDSSLAIQRHAIAEKHGMKVVIGEPISGLIN